MILALARDSTRRPVVCGIGLSPGRKGRATTTTTMSITDGHSPQHVRPNVHCDITTGFRSLALFTLHCAYGHFSRFVCIPKRREHNSLNYTASFPNKFPNSVSRDMCNAGSRDRQRKVSDERRRRRPAAALTSRHVFRMCGGHLDAPFAFVSRAGNVTVRFHSDEDHHHQQQQQQQQAASGFSVGYVTYSRT